MCEFSGLTRRRVQHSRMHYEKNLYYPITSSYNFISIIEKHLYIFFITYLKGFFKLVWLVAVKYVVMSGFDN